MQKRFIGPDRARLQKTARGLLPKPARAQPEWGQPLEPAPAFEPVPMRVSTPTLEPVTVTKPQQALPAARPKAGLSAPAVQLVWALDAPAGAALPGRAGL